MSKQTRRRFLATLGLGGAGAAVAALAKQTPTAIQHPGQQPSKGQSESKGYKVTAHVRKYYRSARV